MKKIGILSDTHNLLRDPVLNILKGCDAILHAGDICREDILDLLRPLGALYAVRGNNDSGIGKYLSSRLEFDIEGIRFLMVHNRMDIRALPEDTKVVIYGHTHRYAEEWEGGRLYLNPGSCGPGSTPTMAILEIEKGRFSVRKITLPCGSAAAQKYI